MSDRKMKHRDDRDWERSDRSERESSHRRDRDRDYRDDRSERHRERDRERDRDRDRDRDSHRSERHHSERDRDRDRERSERREQRRRERERSSHSDASKAGGSGRGAGAGGPRTISKVTEEGVTVTINADNVLGNGSFGVVFEATIQETGQVVAIKKVLQDKRFKNRELQIMKQLDHPNVCKLMHCFYSTGDKPDELYLNLVLEFVPETVHKVTKHYLSMKQLPPLICVKLYMYQLFRSLAYTHSMGVCHRDIKPQNLLVDPSQHILKLCDFGSAKQLVKGEPNVSYICSRYYRAPELIFGATNYTTAIDIWSAGCVLAELLLGQPMFPGESGVDQLVEIIKVLGTPTREEIRAMNPSYTEFKFPQIRSIPWSKVIRRAPPAATDLLSRLLVYTPTDRLTPLQACAHPFFDELRKPTTRLPNGKPLPVLFTFTDQELSASPELAPLLIPEHARTSQNWPPAGMRGLGGGAGMSTSMPGVAGASGASSSTSIPAVASPPPLGGVRAPGAGGHSGASRSARDLRGPGSTSGGLPGGSASGGGGGGGGSGSMGGVGGSSRFVPVSMPSVTARSNSSKLMPVPAPSRHTSSRSVAGPGGMGAPVGAGGGSGAGGGLGGVVLPSSNSLRGSGGVSGADAEEYSTPVAVGSSNGASSGRSHKHREHRSDRHGGGGGGDAGAGDWSGGVGAGAGAGAGPSAGAGLSGRPVLGLRELPGPGPGGNSFGGDL